MRDRGALVAVARNGLDHRAVQAAALVALDLRAVHAVGAVRKPPVQRRLLIFCLSHPQSSKLLDLPEPSTHPRPGVNLHTDSNSSTSVSIEVNRPTDKAQHPGRRPCKRRLSVSGDSAARSGAEREAARAGLEAELDERSRARADRGLAVDPLQRELAARVRRGRPRRAPRAPAAAGRLAPAAGHARRALLDERDRPRPPRST